MTRPNNVDSDGGGATDRHLRERGSSAAFAGVAASSCLIWHVPGWCVAAGADQVNGLLWGRAGGVARKGRA